jgi:hypothetical protein
MIYFNHYHLCRPGTAWFAIARTTAPQPPEDLADPQPLAIRLNQVLNSQCHMAPATAAPDVEMPPCQLANRRRRYRHGTEGKLWHSVNIV